MFSVVIPLWNQRRTIAATVESALTQSYRDFELLVVDDGSTDGGTERLAGLDDSRIRIIAQANAGPGAARNAGIAAARHHWIALLDGDDLWLPGHLAELDRVRARFPRAGLIATAFACVGADGQYRLPASAEARIEAIDYLDRVGDGAWPFCTSCAAIPKSSYAALGGFGDAPVGQDMEYWARIALDRPVAVSTRVTAIYRLGTGGISDSAGGLWRGRALRRARDIGPSVALLLDRYCAIPSPAVRRSIDRYIDARFRYCTRQSAMIGDLRTLRSLPALYLRAPPPVDRLILAIARLPAPAARLLHAAGFRAMALLRRLKRRLA
jgi:glycosyltransferase involved in cell wall biosynthesis